MKNRISLIGLVAFCALAITSRLDAHAFLDHADPRVGSELNKSPDKIELWFTQQPEHAFSSIQVLNSDGKSVDNNDTRTDPKDAKALIISVPKLPPGTYKVVWKVLSIDTHRTEGSFKFTIK